MKRLFAAFLMFAFFSVAVPLVAEAQTKRSYHRDDRYNSEYHDEERNVYKRHRNLINIGIGAGAGAVVGGIVGGKKGALIGAATGAGAGAAYTYGINPKDKERRYFRR